MGKFDGLRRRVSCRVVLVVLVVLVVFICGDAFDQAKGMSGKEWTRTRARFGGLVRGDGDNGFLAAVVMFLRDEREGGWRMNYELWILSLFLFFSFVED